MDNDLERSVSKTNIKRWGERVFRGEGEFKRELEERMFKRVFRGEGVKRRESLIE